MSDKVLAREFPFGTTPKRHPSRKLLLEARDFQDAQNANPIPLFYGTTRLSGVIITPLFGLKSKGTGGSK